MSSEFGYNFTEIFGDVSLKSPSAALRSIFLHCDVALLRLLRKTLRALHLELFPNPLAYSRTRCY